MNWPAIRPTLTTGSVAPYVSTADICSMIFSFSRMRIVEQLVERLDAVAGLQQERAALDHAREAVAQLPRLAGEDERRARLQALERALPPRRRPATRAAAARCARARTPATRLRDVTAIALSVDTGFRLSCAR